MIFEAGTKTRAAVKNEKNNALLAYSDADWAGGQRKSVSGSIIFQGQNPVA